MRPLGIRVRLAAWYSLILAISLSVLGGAAYLAMHHSARATLDAGLRERMAGVRAIVIADAPRGQGELIDELQEYAEGEGAQGKLRVADARGRVVFASPGMESLPGRTRRGRPISVYTTRIGGRRFRILRQSIGAAGAQYEAALAHSTADFDQALDLFRVALYLAAPIFLVIAALGGYWLSGRALAPVDEITRAAQEIGAHDLAQRVAVPRTGDELERLATTLNGMLGRLEAAFQRITQFTADASHELRTPLAVIRTSAELSLRKPRSPDEYQASLSQVLQESEKLSRLIEQLLLLARADAGSAALSMQRADLSAAVRDACREASLLVETKQLRLVQRMTGEPFWIQGDRGSLERLFLVLLDNAVKYTPQGGAIEVSLHRENSFALVQVRDTGIGIAAGDLPHIFDRFYQADRARSRESGGSGLGLAIGRWIAEAHGGDIRVQSAPARGSTFQVRIPLAKE